MYRVLFFDGSGQHFSTGESVRLEMPDPFDIYYNTIKRTGSVRSIIEEHIKRFGQVRWEVWVNGTDCTGKVKQILGV